MVAAQTSLDGGVAVISGARTPWVKAGGALRDVHLTDLAKVAMQETLYRAGWPSEQLDEVILGNVVMPVDAVNPGRVAAIWAGVPDRVPAMTVQRNCASGMEAAAEAAMRIRGGGAKAALAGGAESMSTLPLLFPAESLGVMSGLRQARGPLRKAAAATRLRPRHFRPVAALELGLTDPTCGQIMGRTAETLAGEFGISRSLQDEFALRSHLRAGEARASGRFQEEIVPVYSGSRFEPAAEDTGIRENQSLEALGRLKPIFDLRDGTVTVGNSCQITDGAAVLLLTDAALARDRGLETLGYISDYVTVGLDPARMGLGPVFAIAKLLRQTGLALSDIDLFEINEAFAAQVLACLKAMASARFAREHLDQNQAVGDLDPERLNVNGGAIALGHPVGATGARLVLTLLLEMRRRNAHRGVAALCVGGGQGAAILLERS
jgi:acetyl-CoA acetyltransferase family protein